MNHLHSSNQPMHERLRFLHHRAVLTPIRYRVLPGDPLDVILRGVLLVNNHPVGFSMDYQWILNVLSMVYVGTRSVHIFSAFVA